MVAEYTVKIDGKWYKAGDIIPDVKKAVSTSVEPPVTLKQDEPKQKRQYSRKKQ